MKFQNVQNDFIGLNAQTGTTYTLALTDVNTDVSMTNAAASTVTLPQNSSVAISLLSQGIITWGESGVGQPTIAAGSGATVTVPTGLTLRLRAPGSQAVWTKIGTNTFRVSGDLESSSFSAGVYSLTTNQAATNATTVLVGATWTMPVNYASVGMVIKLKVFYRFVKTTSPPTLTCNLNVGGSSVASFIITSVSSATTSGGMIEGSITIITTGGSGTLMSGMIGQNDHGITNATNWIPQTINIATSTIDTTATKVISLDMKMTTAVASNTLTISQGFIEITKI